MKKIAIYKSKESDVVVKFEKAEKFTKAFLNAFENGEIWRVWENNGGIQATGISGDDYDEKHVFYEGSDEQEYFLQELD